MVGLRIPHVWGPCQRPQWCRRARRCSHTYVETMILHAVMCGWLWRMAELATRGCCCRCNVCARGMCGGGWWWPPAAGGARSGDAPPRCSMVPRMCAGGVGGLSPLGWTGPGGVRYGSCRQRVRVRGSASWPECMCIVHPHAPPLRLHNAMDLCFDTEVVQGSGEQCVPTGGHGLWWPQ